MHYLKISDIKSMFGISKSTIYRWMEVKRFPQPIRFSQKAVRWRASEIEEWVSEVEANTL